MKNTEKSSLKVPALGTPVRCDWLDSVDSPGWQYVRPEERMNFSLRPAMITRGVLVAEDANSVAIATTVAPRGPSDSKEGYLDVLAIPKGCIVGLRVIL